MGLEMEAFVVALDGSGDKEGGGGGEWGEGEVEGEGGLSFPSEFLDWRGARGQFRVIEGIICADSQQTNEFHETETKSSKNNPKISRDFPLSLSRSSFCHSQTF